MEKRKKQEENLGGNPSPLFEIGFLNQIAYTSYMETEYHLKKDSKITIVFVHGIIGSPVRFKDLFPLVPEDISSIEVVLDGHGKEAKDFGKTNRKKWEEQVHNILVEQKEKHQKILYVGHSMGCLFGMRESLLSLVDYLFLLNVPTRPKLGYTTIKECLKCAFGKEENYDFLTPIFLENCSIQMTKNPFIYLTWIPRFFDLFKEIKLTKKIIPEVKVPTICFHSEKDELVRQKALKDLKRNPSFDIHVLKDSGHYYLPEPSLNEMKKEFIKSIEYMRNLANNKEKQPE